MRAVDVLAVMLLATSTGALAVAQPAAGPPRHSTVHDKLARQLYELSGGEKAVAQRIDAMSDAAGKAIASAMPADQARFVAPMQTDTRDELTKLAPPLVEAGVHVYADALTTEELRADIAQLTRDPATPIAGDLATARDEAAAREPPRLARMLPEAQRAVAYRVCEQMVCTKAERDQVARVMAQALSAPKS